MTSPDPATGVDQIPRIVERLRAGWGPSGMGAYHGRHGFETFSHRKSVVAKPTRFDPAFAYPPYGRIKSAIMRRLL